MTTVGWSILTAEVHVLLTNVILDAPVAIAYLVAVQPTRVTKTFGTIAGVGIQIELAGEFRRIFTHKAARYMAERVLEDKSAKTWRIKSSAVIVEAC
jgi:hypothetical protein